MINPGTLDKFDDRLRQFDKGLEFVAQAPEIGIDQTLGGMVQDLRAQITKTDPCRFLDIRLSEDSLTGLAWVVENLPELIAYARAAYQKPDCSHAKPRTDWLGGVLDRGDSGPFIVT